MVFRTYGFNVARTIPSERYLLIEKDGVRLAVGYGHNEEEPALRDVLNFMATANNDRADRTIFISVGGFSQEVRALEKERKIQLWEKDHLEKEIGRAVLNSSSNEVQLSFGGNVQSTQQSIIKGGPNPLFSTSTSDNLTQEKAESMGLIVPTMALAKQFSEEGSIYVNDEGDTSDLAYDSDAQEVVLRPKLTLDEALSISKRELHNVQCKLQYIPYLVFHYTCEVPTNDGVSLEQAEGMLAINGLTSDVYEWNENLETVPSIDDPTMKIIPRIKEDTAKNRVLRAVVEINTKTVESVDDSDSVTIIEKKRVRPKNDAVEMTKKYTAFLPVWCAEGNNGQMIIDATSGEIMRSS